MLYPFQCNLTEKVFIIMESRLTYMFKKEEDYEVLVKMQGKDLKGKGYKPLFPYFQHMKESGAFRKLKLIILKNFSFKYC